MESLVLEQAKKTFQGKLEIKIIPKTSNMSTSNEHDLLRERLNRLKLKEIRVKQAYQEGIDTLSEYKENKSKIITERGKLMEQFSNLKEALIT